MPLAQITWILAETNRDRAKKGTAFRIADFLIATGEPRPDRTKEQQAADMLAQVEVLNQLFGGRDLRSPKQVEGGAP